MSAKLPQPALHRFLDESGDAVFFGKGGVDVIGNEGVSWCFGLTMAKFNTPLQELREQILSLQASVESDGYVNGHPSIVKRIQKGGFYFHAKDDPPEVRERMYKWIKGTDCSVEMVVGRKIPEIFVKKHNKNDSEFYADLLSHLLKNKFQLGVRLVLNVADRGATTRNHVLQMAESKAKERFCKTKDPALIASKIAFNVTTPRREPLLAVPDYLGWAVQRIFERGDTRYYDYIRDRISVVVDIYDHSKYHRNRHYYTPKNPLTAANKIGPPSP